MIFVTVGTHEQPFNRLIQKIDELKKDGIINEDLAKNRFPPLKIRLYTTPKRLQKRKTGICRIFTVTRENRVLHCGNGMRLSE